jgi:probable HAF family extracellular repeat protein
MKKLFAIAALASVLTGVGQAAQKYTLVELKSAKAATGLQATDLNQAGQVAGTIGEGPFNYPVVWDAAGASTLMTITGPAGYASSINASGQVSGYNQEDSAATFIGAVIWNGGNGVATLLNTISTGGVFYSYAVGINAAGTAVGFAHDDSNESQAVVWNGVTPQVLPHAEPLDQSAAQAINANGQIVGVIQDHTSGAVIPYFWDTKTNGPLLTLGGEEGVAAGINDSAQIVGWSDSSTGSQHATLWTNGMATDLGFVTGYTSSVAHRINSAGMIVGYSAVSGNDFGRATLWDGKTVLDLNSVLSTADAKFITLTDAVGINDKGWIAVNGQDTREANPTAYVLKPVTAGGGGGALDEISLLAIALGLLGRMMIARRRRGVH